MTWGFHRDFPQNTRKYSTIFLAFIWTTGLICGVLLSRSAGDSFSSLMHEATCRSAPIVCLLTVSLLPFLFSAFAVYIHSNCLLAFLCFIKGCLFALISSGILLAFGSAGWLIRLLLMFSDFMCLVPLWWFWISCISGDRQALLRPVLQASSAAAGIVCLDYMLISPFLVKLFEI